MVNQALPLRPIISLAANDSGRSLNDFTVLSTQRDPYRLDTPAGHEKGRWLADAYHQVNPTGERLHLRGLHYRLVGRVDLPNGKPYINTDEAWTFLSERAIKAARFLGYLPWDALRDARNAPPKVFSTDYEAPRWVIRTANVLLWLPENLEPRLEVAGDVYRQPWQQIIIAEKSGVGPILEPIAKRFNASLALPGGELSDQMLYDLLKVAAKDGRPLAIHQLGDFDPAGHQMGVSTARTAQAIVDSQFPDLTVTVHTPALTMEQCRKWNLPSTPLKETERRGDRWREAMGWEQTELDAAVALAPDEFRSAIEASLEQYFDDEVAYWADMQKKALEEKANARLADTLGDSARMLQLAAERKLAELSALANEVNDALRFDPAEVDLDVPDCPNSMIGTASPQETPLFDSREQWDIATLRLVARKGYAAAND